MKRFIKNNIKVFVAVIISGIVFTGIGVYAASQYFAKDISFTPTNEKFKKDNGEPIDNVEDALNALYSSNNKVDLLWTNSNTKSSFNNQMLNLDLRKYKYIIVSAYSDITNIDNVYTICDVIEEIPSDVTEYSIGYCYIGKGIGRFITASYNGVYFSRGIHHNVEWNNKYGIPYKIYGVMNMNLN